jgi:transcriptional regulator, gntR family
MKRKSTSRDLSYLALPELTEGSAEELTEPVYERIASRLRELIFSQEIVLGDSLPSLRTVAAKLSVSVDTVRRAYFILIDEGIVESKIGSGFKVVGLPPKEKLLYREEGAA